VPESGESEETSSESSDEEIVPPVSCEEDHPLKIITPQPKKNKPVTGEIETKVTGPKPFNVSAKRNANGSYTVEGTPEHSGEYTVIVTQGGKPVRGSPFQVSVKAAPRPPPGPPIKAVAGEPATWSTSVIAKNPNDKVNLVYEISGPQQFNVKLERKDDGTFSIEGTPELPGKYEVIVRRADNNKPITTAPFTLNVEEPEESSSSEAEPSPLIITGAGKPTKIIIPPPKAKKRKQPQSEELTIKTSGPENFTVKKTPNADGTHTLEFTLNSPGDYRLDVSRGGEPVKGSPYSVHIDKPEPAEESSGEESSEEEPDPSKCVLFGDALKKGVVGEINRVTFQAKGSDGENLDSGGIDFSGKVRFNGPAEMDVAIEDNGDGSYTITYEPKISGDYVLSIELGDKQVNGSPFPIHVEPSSVLSVEHTEVIGIDLLSKTKVGTTETIILAPKDEYGNKYINAKDKIKGTLTVGTEVLELPIIDNGDGTYSMTCAPKHAGEGKLEVTFDGQSISETAYNVKVAPLEEKKDVKPPEAVKVQEESESDSEEEQEKKKLQQEEEERKKLAAKQLEKPAEVEPTKPVEEKVPEVVVAATPEEKKPKKVKTKKVDGKRITEKKVKKQPPKIDTKPAKRTEDLDIVVQKKGNLLKQGSDVFGRIWRKKNTLSYNLMGQSSIGESQKRKGR